MVSLNFASWNQLDRSLRSVEALGAALSIDIVNPQSIPDSRLFIVSVATTRTDSRSYHGQSERRQLLGQSRRMAVSGGERSGAMWRPKPIGIKTRQLSDPR